MATMTRQDRDTRADGEITRDVWRSMKADFEVPEDRISIKTKAGVVTIVGTVARASQKAAAEACAARVEGVRGVLNQIEVELGFQDEAQSGG